MIFACRGAHDCTHDTLTLYWCAECSTHACGHLLAVAMLGLRADAFPPRPAADTDVADLPRLRVVGGHRYVGCYFVVEWFARTSAVSTYRHLRWLGLS